MIFKPLDKDEEWNWIRDKAKILAVEDSQGIVAYDDRGIQAVAAFDSFTVDACNVHLAIDNPFVIRAGFLHEICRHLFIQCGRKRIFGLVPSNNLKALKLDKHIGMTEVGIWPNALVEGVDYHILEMTREECRWIPEMRAAA